MNLSQWVQGRERPKGKFIFFSTRDPALAKRLAKRGVQILHVGSDVLAAVAHHTRVVAEIKEGV